MGRLLNLLLICMLLPGGNQCLANLPVLPMPQLYKIGSNSMAYPPRLSFNSRSLGPQALGRLQERWEEFMQELPADKQLTPSVCHLVILGHDAGEDAKVKELLTLHQQPVGEEGYYLLMTDSIRLIAANTEAGLFYGLQTLRQLTGEGFSNPVEIADWPEFRHRVVMDDISRGPISNLDHIKYQIRRLAGIKVNYLTFYIEHVIKTASHPDFAPADGRLTIADIRELSAFAAQYHIQLIGSFQSFGHFEKILAQPAYRQMAATSNLIDPDNPAAQRFLTDMIGEIADAFSAPWINVNCDETFDLGKGSTKAAVDQMGIAAYYAKHIRFLNGILKEYKKKMMLWGDFALQHEEVLDLLPKDLTWLTWEYGTPASFDKWIQPFQKRGLPFMVCLGILNSNRLFPDHEMAVKNIAGFAKAGKESGAAGVFSTVWDDGGSAFFSSVWYSVYKAAEKSWNLHPETDNSFDERYCMVAYGDGHSNFTRALHTFLQLRRLPLSWNMTDQPWYQSSLPQQGRSLLLCNANIDTARALVRSAGLQISQFRARWNIHDIAALQLALDQYNSILNWRSGVATQCKALSIAKNTKLPYRKEFLQSSGVETWTKVQEEAARDILSKYTALWHFEDQPYWLDQALQPVLERIQAAAHIREQLGVIATGTGKDLDSPDSISSRLQVYETAAPYFQNWLFCGPFKGIGHQPPSFLYFPGKKSVLPKPGDQFNLNDRTFRWKKFASPTGGVTYMEDQWPDGVTATEWVYAFASIHSDSTRELAGFLQAGEGAQVFCNGKRLVMQKKAAGLPFLSSPAFQLSFPLIKGINYIVIKLPGNTPDNAFAFRLHPSVTQVNHKHKYYLNPNFSDHEAE